MTRRPWTSTDIDRLMAMFTAGEPDAAIAIALERSCPSIRRKLAKLRKIGNAVGYRRTRRFDHKHLHISKPVAYALRPAAKRHTEGSVRSLLAAVVDKLVRDPSLIDSILEQREAAE